MSGGSYDYAYMRVQDMAYSLRRKETEPLRAAFAKHLELVAEAMRAIEWVDSGDYGGNQDEEAIRKVLGTGAELAAAVEMAERARDVLEETLKRAGVR